MKLNNSIAQKKQEQTFSMAVRSDALQSLMNDALTDKETVKDLTSDLISLVAGNTLLQKCKPDSIVAAALRGATMKLSLPLQHYSIVPYGEYAQFVISYKGYCALAMDTKLYAKLGSKEVREGEYKGIDPLTGQPEIDWIKNGAERAKKPIIGYYAYYLLKDGFSNSLYWTYDEILNHADTYVPAFSRKKWEDFVAGKISKTDSGMGSPWYGLPTSIGHQKMCKKTVIKQLLNDGIAPMSTKLMRAIRMDDLQEKGGEIIYANDSRIVNVSTGEVVADVNAKEIESEIVEEEIVVDPEQSTPKKEAAPAKKKEAQPKAEQPAVEQMTLEGMKG